MKQFLLATCLFFLFFPFLNGQSLGDATISTERYSIFSNHLKEDRTFQIYLPQSYFFSDRGNYPVIYLIDGDYNFHYDVGLVEMLSSVGGKIPEMIVVGITAKGSEVYQKNCAPTDSTAAGGNANNYMAFIEKELKPYIKKNFRVSAYDILIGHSMGGLFTTNYFLENPTHFDTYIAIDPSLWWNNYVMADRADSIFQQTEGLAANLYISLANTQGMGVRNFVGVLDKYFPGDPHWEFLYYENENHGSVHWVTIKDALEKLFKDWEVGREQFYSFTSAQDLMDHYKKLSTEFETSFALPAYAFGNMVYYYYRKNLTDDLALLEKEIAQNFPSSLDEYYIQLATNHLQNGKVTKAETLYRQQIANDPNSFRALDGMAKIFLQQNNYKEAKALAKKAIQVAKKVKVRQWQLNELMTSLEKIESAMKK